MKDLTLIIPAKEEAESLPFLMKELISYKCKKIIITSREDLETINSIKNNSDILLLSQKKPGVGSAIIEGINKAKTKYFCILMADGSTNPKYIKNMYKNCKRERLDMIFSSRYQKPNGGSADDTLVTYVGNFFFTKLGNIFFSTNISDILFMFVLGKKKSFKILNLKSYDHRICVELALKAKFNELKYTCIPSFERKRFGGTKKVNALKDGILILSEMIKLFFTKNKTI